MHRPSSSPAWGRRLALPAILAALALALLAPVAAFSAPLTSVFVNGVRIDSYPEIRNGVSYLPINAMARALQAEISWDSRLNSVKVNGEVVQATAFNIDGKIYLPVESFVSAMGGTVVYDGRENVIRVQTGGLTAMAPGASPESAPASVSTPQARTTVPITPPSAPTTPTPRPVSSTVPITPPASTVAVTPGGGAYLPPTTPPYGTSPYGTSPGGGYSPNTTNPGTPEPYLSNPQQPSAQPRPVDAPASLGPGLDAGPMGGSGTQASVAYSPIPANAQRPNEVYVPRSAQNAVFQVTVTNLENVTVIKDFYRPRTGYKFIVVYLSQQNISEQVQIYTGRFSLLDQKNTSYDYIEGLSNFWLVILRPFGINFGYLVYEVPVDAKPMNLVLHALNQAPLTLNL